MANVNQSRLANVCTSRGDKSEIHIFTEDDLKQYGSKMADKVGHGEQFNECINQE